ncbi:uncharacterized protein LOC123675893 [Harmonia axyridis]|uniref:uncharacterized protein LOC123675893 n=1 Tax=Harmonia axyridis TaxID=115357 RepID=UPI001E276544|nr:uncharacterized protein LOC123675893 [Harmonia axyridis]
MSDNFTYNGDHLLKIFGDLQIDLGDLNPNVVRAWFDTDDQDMIYLLNFMCSALSRKNILLAQELTEFQSIENPLYDTELEKACRQLEEKNPGIFDYDLNLKQLKVSVAELELLEQEEQKLDNLLKMDGHLQQSLSQSKLNIERESAELDFRYEEAYKRCEELSHDLDSKNRCLHEKLSRDLFFLSNFQSSEPTHFLNLKNLNDIYDSIEFKTTLEDMVEKQHSELSGYFSQSNINLNSTPNNENFEDKLEMSQVQIFSSYFDCLKTKMEAESLYEVNNFLENFFTQDYPLKYNTSIVSDMIEEREMLLSKIEKKASIIAEEPITSIKIKKSLQELKDVENNLECFNQISKYYSKVSSTTFCAMMLLLQEKKCIEETDQTIRHISKYILHNLDNTKYRLEIMWSYINNFNNFSREPLEQRCEVLRNIVNIYGQNILKDAYLCCNQLKKNLINLENNLFLNRNIVEIVEKLYKTDVAKQFITSGTTNLTITIPKPVMESLKSIQSNLGKQTSTLKLLLHIYSSTLKKLEADKWLKNSRLIWIYFLVAPEKLQDLFCHMEEELKCKEIKAVRFKE